MFRELYYIVENFKEGKLYEKINILNKKSNNIGIKCKKAVLLKIFLFLIRLIIY